MRGEDVEELRALAATYARAVDRRDVAAFVGVFAGDAVLEVWNPASAPSPSGVCRGHGEIAAIVERITRFPRTFHFVGQSLYDVAPDDDRAAVGEVYCLAHHLTGDGTDIVMFIRYDDHYGRDRADGRWRITHRRVLVDWTETHPVS